MFFMCFMMFYNVLCLASGATVGVAASVTSWPPIALRRPQGDRRYRGERDRMLNSVLKGDWSNSVPGRKIPEGPSANVTAPSTNVSASSTDVSASSTDIVASNSECLSVLTVS